MSIWKHNDKKETVLFSAFQATKSSQHYNIITSRDFAIWRFSLHQLCSSNSNNWSVSFTQSFFTRLFGWLIIFHQRLTKENKYCFSMAALHTSSHCNIKLLSCLALSIKWRWIWQFNTRWATNGLSIITLYCSLG